MKLNFIPVSLQTFIDFHELSQMQKRHLDQRLSLIAEIVRDIDESYASEMPLPDLIDSLELDVAAVISSGTDTSKDVISGWLIHSTWTFEFSSREELRRSLSPKLTKVLDETLPMLRCNYDEAKCWLKSQSVNLRLALQELSNAKTHPHAVACLFAIDVVFSMLYSGLIKLRLIDL